MCNLEFVRDFTIQDTSITFPVCFGAPFLILQKYSIIKKKILANELLLSC